MDSAYRKAYADATKKHYGKAFMRQLSSLNDNYTGISESFFDAQYSNYAILGWSPTQARFSKSGKNIALTNFSFISFASIGYLSSSVFATPLSRIATQIYNFKLEGFIKDGADDIAIIDCQIKDKKAGPKNMYFEGCYYINTTNFNVSRIQGFVRNFKINSKGPVKLDALDSPIDAIYANSADEGLSTLKYVNLTVNARIKYAGLVGGGKLTYNSQIFLLEENDTLSGAPFIALNLASNDVETLEGVAYDPEFWINNPIIKRTPVEEEVIRNFEKKKVLGNYFDK